MIMMVVMMVMVLTTTTFWVTSECHTAWGSVSNP